MKDDSDAEFIERIRDGLGHESPLLPFAIAVGRHLAAAPAPTGHTERLPERINDVLRGVGGSGDEERIERLLRDAPLLASFFQNADLLDTRAAESAAVARLVMEAVAVAWEEG